jgi:hypothetical protein
MTQSPIFTGQFWFRGRWWEDQDVLVFIDAPGQTVTDVLPYFAALRDQVNRVYDAVGQRQDALWITAHPLYILQN